MKLFPALRRPHSKLLLLAIIFVLTSTLTALANDNTENSLQELKKQHTSNYQIVGRAATPFLLDSIWAYKFGATNGAGNWGYTAPDGQQYSIMGIQIGVVIVNATTLDIVDTVTGISCLWQEMKTYRNYLYAVSECGSGLRVIDLQYLPDSVHYIGAFPTSDQNTMSCHNISIDTITGYLYAEGTTGFGRNIFILSLANPESPSFVNAFGFFSHEIHDITANDDTIWVAEGSAHSFSAMNLSNKFNPFRIGYVAIPSGGYVHNAWPSDDRKLLASTEETTGKTVKVWNIEDLQNIELYGEYLGPNQLAHNVYIIGDYMYMSHYGSGIRVVDLRLPGCQLEVAAYNPPTDNTWGCFPFTGADSLVYASNMDGVMSILKLRRNPDYVSDDIDGDGVEAICDNCPSAPNASQIDADGDSYGDPCDNCAAVFNVSQTDSDSDGFGDVCDACPGFNDNLDTDLDEVADGCDICPGFNDNLDGDGDAVPNGCDNCPAVANANQADNDSDGIGNLCDICPNTFNPGQEDLNNDQIGDACCCVGRAGDINGSGNALPDIIDLNYLVNRIFRGGPGAPCVGEGDVNQDGTSANIIDLNYTVNYIFRGGALPPNCPTS